MADLFDFNHGGATHPGARAIIHPGAASDVHVMWYSMVAQNDKHITLDDGYTYDKRTGAVRGPAERPGPQNRLAVTEGSAMFDAWSDIAVVPRRRRPYSMPTQSRGWAHPYERAVTALLRLLRRR
ncbi:hypothetical protein [Kocuria flava]|uniref:Uncharacterized protein n=1 Tax=Kocuria flava TaxID=446860 RepID=A0ABQ0X6W0_9MICC|nr:hypothetical protein [Kocuria flava]GEO93363.1 hypothetical protein KFL01_26690 [Kocuria flava]